MYQKFEERKPYELLDTSKYPPEVAGRFNSFITTQFDDSLSVEMQMRSIIKWAIDNFKEMDETYNDFTENIVDESINPFIVFLNDLIEYMNEFIETFDTKFQEEILMNLQKWYNDGTLETLINESLDTKYHEMNKRLTAQLAQTMTNKDFDSWVATLLNGGPSIFYETLSALESDYPDGAEGVALVRETDPARIYVWNPIELKWSDYGAYQGIEVKDKTITTPKIAEKAVKPDKTTFFERTRKNLFDGEFIDNITSNASGEVLWNDSGGRYSAVIPIVDGETYTITKYEGGNRFNVLLTNEYPTEKNLRVESLKYIYTSPIKNVEIATITNDVNANYMVITTNSNHPFTPKLQVELGIYSTEYEEPYTLTNETLESIGYVPIKKSDKNLFNGKFIGDLALYRLLDENGEWDGVSRYLSYSENVRWGALVPIESGKQYTVSKNNKGNRFTVALVSDYPRGQDSREEALYIYEGETGPVAQSHTFTNDVGAKYLFVLTNSDSHDLPNLQVEVGEIATEYAPPEFTNYVPLKKSDKNLFNGKFVGNLTAFRHIIDGDWDGVSREVRYTEESRRGALVKIEPGKTYTVSKNNAGNRFYVLLLDEYPLVQGFIKKALYSYEGMSGNVAQSHTFINDVGATWLYVLTNRDSSDLPNIQVEEGAETTPYEPPEFVPEKYIKFPEMPDAINYIQSDLFTADDVETFVNPEDVKTSEIIDLVDDELLAEYPHFVSKEDMGAVTDDERMYKYTFKPHILDSTAEIKIPKIIIISGVHGNEKNTVYSTYNFFKKLCTEWRNSRFLEYFRFNVEFIWVPVVNPSGFDLHIRGTTNGVDINRDYPHGWSYGSTTGDHPVSELETQLVLDLLEENEDASFVIDYHRTWFRDDERGERITYALTSDAGAEVAINKQFNKLGRKWQKEYPFFPQREDYEFGYTTEPTKGGGLAYQGPVQESSIVALEMVEQIEWQETWSRYDWLTILIGTELLVSVLISLMELIDSDL